MKIKVRKATYEEVNAIPHPKHRKPMRPLWLLSALIYLLSLFETLFCGFTCRKIGFEKLKKKEPFLILMNHSAFLDLKIASRIFFPRRYNIVATTDSFVGKSLLMRLIGCIPTQKFVTDLQLIKDIKYALHTLRNPVLLFPEAGYSFDGCCTTLPDTLGSFVKMMKVPLVSVITKGVYSRDPLYNMLQIRRVRPSAEATYLLSPEQIEQMSAEEINRVIQEAFTFDAFAWQKENGVVIDEPFRADGLHRILYRCARCEQEGGMEGKGTHLTCRHCGGKWELSELGELHAVNGEERFKHIPDWYAWERQCVAREITENSYRLACDVDIVALVDEKALYRIGEGTLIHDQAGFTLNGCGGSLLYRQSPRAAYCLNADFYWYEIGDVIGIGDRSMLYYCFPQDEKISVTKARLATEELYKLTRPRRK